MHFTHLLTIVPPNANVLHTPAKKSSTMVPPNAPQSKKNKDRNSNVAPSFNLPITSQRSSASVKSPAVSTPSGVSAFASAGRVSIVTASPKKTNEVSTKPSEKFTIIRQYFNDECVALCIDGGSTKYRPFFVGNEYANTTKNGKIAPVFVFNFKSGHWAVEMHDKMLIYADAIAELEGLFSRQLCPLFVAANEWTGALNYVVGPKAILTPGICPCYCYDVIHCIY